MRNPRVDETLEKFDLNDYESRFNNPPPANMTFKEFVINFFSPFFWYERIQIWFLIKENPPPNRRSFGVIPELSNILDIKQTEYCKTILFILMYSTIFL